MTYYCCLPLGVTFRLPVGAQEPDYTPVSTLPDPTGHISEYTGVLNNEVKGLIKKSNVYLGSEKPL
jgi:hypothetical protein